MHCRLGQVIPTKSSTEASSNSTISLVSVALRSIEYISCGNSAVGSGVPYGLLPPEKLAAKIVIYLGILSIQRQNNGHI